MPSLTVRKAGEPPRRIELAKAKVVIGRSARNDVHVEDLFASRTHAELRRDEDQFWLTDLDSANGTLVNNRRISGTVQLFPGDRVQIGGTVLELDAPEATGGVLRAPHPMRRSTDGAIAASPASPSALPSTREVSALWCR